MFRKQQHSRIARLLAFNNHHRAGFRCQLGQAQQRPGGRRCLELPLQPPVRETPQGQGAELLALPLGFVSVVIETHRARCVRICPAPGRLAVSRMCNRRGGRIGRDRHNAHRAAIRRALGRLFSLGRYFPFTALAFSVLGTLLAVRLGDPEVFRQALRRLNLPTPQDIRRQCNQIAAPVIRREVRPRAGISVNRQTAGLAVVPCWIGRHVLTAGIPSA